MRWLRELTGWRRAAVVAVAGVVILTLGAVLASPGGGDTRGPTRPATPVAGDDAQRAGAEDSPDTSVGPTGVSGGVGVGFSRSEAGAVAAAMSYATAPQSWLYLSDEALAASVAGVTVPEARAEISRQIQQIHLDASPWIYLVQPNSVTALRSDIQGWAESPDRIANYWTLWRGEG